MGVSEEEKEDEVKQIFQRKKLKKSTHESSANTDITTTNPDILKAIPDTAQT